MEPIQQGDAESILVHCDCDCGQSDADALAGEILRYLRAHRHACDTTEGIARWWIKRQRLEDTQERVQAALNLLLADARVVARTSSSGVVLYQLGAPATDSPTNAAPKGEDG